jgi:hypothetical protein
MPPDTRRDRLQHETETMRSWFKAFPHSGPKHPTSCVSPKNSPQRPCYGARRDLVGGEIGICEPT